MFSFNLLTKVNSVGTPTKEKSLKHLYSVDKSACRSLMNFCFSLLRRLNIGSDKIRSLFVFMELMMCSSVVDPLMFERISFNDCSLNAFDR